MSNNQKIVGISFPKPLLEKLDSVRSDVPRSKYIVRLLENKFNLEKENLK
jgi:metal-responsive CopG/Arc/MetJ family transcriptional regulator